MADVIIINGRSVGASHPCYVVAEAGSNHNGNLDQALRLIEVAAEAGASAVKFQLFSADKLYPPTAGEADYLKAGRSIHDIIREMEMPMHWLAKLKRACDAHRVDFLCSAFAEASVDALEPFVPAYKVASYELTHHPLLRYVARKGKPVILSTGASTLEEISAAVRVLREAGCRELALMQCTAKYPAPLESLHLRAIPQLREVFGVPVGLSDHSLEPLIGPLGAVACGAALLEKHFTLDKTLPGPDHAFALEPAELKQMIAAVRQLEQALGHEGKIVDAVETELRDFARRCVFAVRDIAAGELLSTENTAVLRKGKHPPGVEPARYDEILGRRVRVAVKAGTPLRWQDLL